MDSTSKLLGNIPFKSLETILNSIPSGVVITDTKGRFLYVNSRGIELFGFDTLGFDLDEEFTKLKALKRDGSPFPENEMPIVNSVRNGEPIRNVEMMIECANGKRLHVLVSSAPLYDANCIIIAAIVIFNDITRQIQTEIQLKESEDRYRTVVETTVSAIVVHQNGRFLFLNPAALRLFGARTPQELETRTIWEFMAPSEQQKIAERISQSAEGKNVLPNQEEIIRLDGKRVPVEAVGGPIRYGGKNATLVILRDITRQAELTSKLTEYTNHLEQLVEARTRQIVDNEKQYHEIYDSFGEALIATDWEFNVIHWNKAAERVTAQKAADALGKKLYNVLPEMTTVNVTPYFEALQQKKPARFMMNVVSHETKKPSIFEISTYPSMQGIIIIVEDKTEEEQNKRLSAIGATAGMVGHDIRNPLQAIEGDLYLLKEYLTSMPQSQTKTDAAESIEEIDKNVSYINKIVADLQDYARQLNPEYTAVNLHSLTQDLIDNTDIPANINVALKVDADFTLKTDPTLIRRAITNLIINAIQAMPAGGTLEVRAQKTDREAQIRICDTGTGIPDEVKPKLFTPMMTTKAKGQGLGLAVVKRLVEALKGTITFESQEGKGTTFTIKLSQN
jgi:PAS domain S-box-containing protein